MESFAFIIATGILMAGVCQTRSATLDKDWRVRYEQNSSNAVVFNDWLAATGSWTEKQNELHKQNDDSDALLLLRAPVVRQAICVEYEVMSQAPGDLSLLLGSADGTFQDALFVGIGSQGNKLHKIVFNGRELAKTETHQLTPGKWHKIRVLREKGNISLFIDGEKVLKSPDAPEGYAGPYLALYGWNAGAFRNFKVSGKEDPVLMKYLQGRARARDMLLDFPSFDLYAFAGAKRKEIEAGQKLVCENRPTAMRLKSESKVICKQPGRYIGWPTIAKTADGELLTVFSGDREEHVCPFGKDQLVRSKDNGGSWTAPQTIHDSPLDDRDAGLLVTRQGTIILSWFTWDFPESQITNNASWNLGWRTYLDSVTPADRRKHHGYWTSRSIDNGKTWAEPVRTPSSAPHGPIQLKDGRLLYVGKGWIAEFGGQALSVAESKDEGQTWQTIWAQPLTNAEQQCLSEPHAVELPDGRIIAMLRYDGSKTEIEGYLQQIESADGGHSWTAPVTTPIWGHPPHLILLKDGRVLCSYGYRKAPFGQRACLSYDGGKTWDIEHEILVRSDALNGDLGYPASVELADGTIVTVYYQVDKANETTCLMMTRWTPPPFDPPAKHNTGLSVSMGAPVVIALAPPAERRWGFYQFPIFKRTKAGDILASFHVGDDSHDGAGEHQAAPYFISKDKGKTWATFNDSAQVVSGKTLKDGSTLEFDRFPRISASELGLTPVRTGIRDSPAYGNCFDLYLFEDLPDNIRGAPVVLRTTDSLKDEAITAKIDFPGAAVRAYVKTWTSGGAVKLPGYLYNNLPPLTLALKNKSCVELSNGALLCAVNSERIDENHPDLPGNPQMYLLASLDQGRSWKLSSTIACIPERVKHGLWEQTLQILPGGRLMCIMRSEVGGSSPRALWIATSDDNGLTWDDPRILNGFGVEPEALVLKNGISVVSYGRPGVELRFCADGLGEKWTEPYVIQSPASCGYTQLMSTGDDSFLVIFSDFCHRDTDWQLHKSIKVMQIKVTPGK